MIASQEYRFPLSEDEHVKLIRGVPMGEPVHTTLGHPVNLIWRKGEPMPSAVRVLAEIRGVFTENADGAGI